MAPLSAVRRKVQSLDLAERRDESRKGLHKF